MRDVANQRQGERRSREASGNSWIAITGRVLLVVAGGYLVSASLVSASSVMLPFVGLHRSEAVVLASMCGFVLYLGLLIWGFAQQSLMRLGGMFALLACGGQVITILLPRAGG